MAQPDDFPFRTQVSVQWGDMDAARHVNNVVYLRWAETSRIEFFEKIFPGTFDFSRGIGPILAWQDCKYIFPLTYPDVALLGVRVDELRDDRFLLELQVFSAKHERLAAISRQSIMAYDYGALKKAALPAEWVAGLQPYR